MYARPRIRMTCLFTFSLPLLFFACVCACVSLNISVDEVESELKPVLRKAAKDNTVITMTMNSGMADLILNFVCSAKKV